MVPTGVLPRLQCRSRCLVKAVAEGRPSPHQPEEDIAEADACFSGQSRFTRSCCTVLTMKGLTGSPFWAQPPLFIEVTGYLKFWELFLPTKLASQGVGVHRQAQLHIPTFSYTANPQGSIFLGKQARNASSGWPLPG